MRKPKNSDLFICHAHEDKDEIARPLALALQRKGLRIWYDEISLRLGDSLMEGINRALAECGYGVVILSPSFFKKKKSWTKRELAGLYAKPGKQKAILPIWHNISESFLRKHAPSLLDLKAYSSKMPIHKLVDAIASEIHAAIPTDLNKFAPTGIQKLDNILGGGLRRGASFTIEGPKGIGKTTLAMQMQFAALDRGEACVYISYKETPSTIIEHLLRLGAPLQQYVESGKFMILDNFSSPAGISDEEIKRSLPEIFHKAIVRVEDPSDQESYYKLQIALLDKMGSGGVNVIASTNERYQMMQTANKTEFAEKYFKRFKARLGSMEKRIGIHLVTDLPFHTELLALLGNLEDGVIRMNFRETPGQHRIRYMRIENLGSCDTGEHEFIITDDGIQIFQ